MLFVWLFLYGAVMLLCRMAAPLFDYAELVGLTFYTLALIIWILATGKGASLGFRKVLSFKKHLFLIPWLMPVFYHLFRFGFQVPAWTDLLGIFCAAVLEEILFRGFLLRRLRPQLLGIILSSLAFGAAHFLNLENGAGLVPVIYQVIFSLCVGFSLSGLSLSCGSIFPCVGIHILINVTAGDAYDVAKDPLFWSCAAICIGCGIYSMFLIRKGEGKNVAV